MGKQTFADKVIELIDKLEYYFAKKWLDKTFGKQDYWGDYIEKLIAEHNILKNE